MNLRNFLKYTLFRDTTFGGEFREMQRLAGPDCPKSFVDVGASNGFYMSNSFPFIARGWQAVLIEPHPVAFEKMKKLHAGKPNVACLNVACADTDGQRPLYFAKNSLNSSHSTLCTDDSPRWRKMRSDEFTMVQVRRLDGLLREQELPAEFGILSVDAECMDYEVLLGLDLKQWRPRVIVTENYAPKDGQKSEYLQAHGYRHARQLMVNAFWLREQKEGKK
jgi:FkbM family methyltransferase